MELTGADLSSVARVGRHALLNDLQILGGWLHLGRLGTAVEYLNRVRSRITRESDMASLSHPDLEAALILSRVRAESAGISFLATVLGAPDPEYLSSAAAGRDGRGGTQLPKAFPVAVLLLISGIISRATEVGFSRIEAMIVPAEDRLEIALKLPSGARGLVGLEDEVLSSGGFAATRLASARVVGLEWREARPTRGRLSSVAEGRTEGLEMLIVAGRE